MVSGRNQNATAGYGGTGFLDGDVGTGRRDTGSTG